MLTLIVLLILLPRVGGDETKEPEPATPVTGLGLSLAATSPRDLDALGRSGFDLDLKPAPPATDAATAPVTDPARESEAQIVADLQRETRLPLNTEPVVDLAQAARLCTDLACIKDAGELKDLLSRAAELLDASGIVVWIAGVGGDALKPTFSHGYSDQTLAKMKSLSSTDANAVSMAFRSGRIELVAAGGGRNGAIVTPINTASGCVGAMAAEIRHGAESSRNVQALATIIAAQLATLVATDDVSRG